MNRKTVFRPESRGRKGPDGTAKRVPRLKNGFLHENTFGSKRFSREELQWGCWVKCVFPFRNIRYGVYGWQMFSWLPSVVVRPAGARRWGKPGGYIRRCNRGGFPPAFSTQGGKMAFGQLHMIVVFVLNLLLSSSISMVLPFLFGWLKWLG